MRREESPPPRRRNFRKIFPNSRPWCGVILGARRPSDNMTIKQTGTLGGRSRMGGPTALMGLLCAVLPLEGQSTGKAGAGAANWHQWRGPEANGVSRTATPPTTWSEKDNIRWKVEIAGKGGATPIVWGGQGLPPDFHQHRQGGSVSDQAGRPAGSRLRNQVPEYELSVRDSLS